MDKYNKMIKENRKEMNRTVKTLGGLVLVGAVANMLPKGKQVVKIKTYTNNKLSKREYKKEKQRKKLELQKRRKS